MIRTLSTKIAVAAAGVVLAGGAAVAAAAVASPPEAADPGLTRAQERAGFPVPASSEDHPAEPGDADGELKGGGPVDNHGAEVSAVAHDHSVTGREHGKAVSEVARAGHGSNGAGHEDAEDAEDLEADDDEVDDDEDEDEADEADD